MKIAYINRLDIQESIKLRDAYCVILNEYEELAGGPTACRGIAEYYGVRSSINALNKHIQDLWNAQQ